MNIIYKIINFFKKLFTKQNASQPCNAVTRAIVYNNKLLFNNCIWGYTVTNITFEINGNSYTLEDIPYGEPQIITVQSSELPTEGKLSCNIVCFSDGEFLKNLSGKVIIKDSKLTTININPEFLNLHKISFDATVQESKNNLNNI